MLLKKISSVKDKLSQIFGVQHPLQETDKREMGKWSSLNCVRVKRVHLRPAGESGREGKEGTKVNVQNVNLESSSHSKRELIVGLCS